MYEIAPPSRYLESPQLLLPQRLAAVAPVHEGHLSEASLRTVATEHRLPFGPKSWSTLRALQGEDRVIFPRQSEDCLSLEALNQTLRNHYRNGTTMSGLGKSVHYTANTLTAAYELATDQLLHATSEQQRSAELGGLPIVSSAQAYEYVDAFRFNNRGNVLEKTMGRIGFEEVKRRYPFRLAALPEGQYRADDMIIMRDPTKRQWYQGGTVTAMTPSEFAAALESTPLNGQVTQPGLQYVLQRYATAMVPNGYQKRPSTIHPPTHERITEAGGDDMLGPTALSRLTVRGAIQRLTGERERRIYGAIVRDLNGHYAEGFATPFDRLFCRDKDDPKSIYIYKKRLTSTVNGLAEYEGDGSAELLLTPNQATALWYAHIETGDWSPLSIAAHKEVAWDEKTTVTIADPESVALFAMLMGYSFDQNVFHTALQLAAGKNLCIPHQHLQAGSTYTDPRQHFRFSPRKTELHDSSYKVYDIQLHDMTLQAAHSMLEDLFHFAPSSHEIHVFGQYLKAIRQQKTS